MKTIANIEFVDGAAKVKFNNESDGVVLTGSLAYKLRRVNEVIVEFETEKEWMLGIDVLDRIKAAL